MSTYSSLMSLLETSLLAIRIEAPSETAGSTSSEHSPARIPSISSWSCSSRLPCQILTTLLDRNSTARTRQDEMRICSNVGRILGVTTPILNNYMSINGIDMSLMQGDSCKVSSCTQDFLYAIMQVCIVNPSGLLLFLFLILIESVR